MQYLDLFDASYTYPEVREALEACAPWGLLTRIDALIARLAERGVAEGTLWERQSGVFVGEGVSISPDATILPPCVLGDGCEIRPGAYIRGRVIVGGGCVIGNSTEVKNAILFDGVTAPHFNYIGDSILGHLAHLGAGVILSNVRLDKKPVTPLWDPPCTPLRKAGALIGDRAEIGCHTVVCPGAVVPRGDRIPPLSLVVGYGRTSR